jgi:hypothetical protein
MMRAKRNQCDTRLARHLLNCLNRAAERKPVKPPFGLFSGCSAAPSPHTRRPVKVRFSLMT